MSEQETSQEKTSVDEGAMDCTCECLEIVPNGSTRGRDILVSNTGYSFNMVKRTQNGCIWLCSVRNKAQKHCGARVIQRYDAFETKKQHNHLGEPGLLEKIKLVKQVSFAKITIGDKM